MWRRCLCESAFIHKGALDIGLYLLLGTEENDCFGSIGAPFFQRGADMSNQTAYTWTGLITLLLGFW